MLKAAGHVSEGGIGRQSSKGAKIKRGEIGKGGGVDNAIAPHQSVASMANSILVLLSSYWGKPIIPAMAHDTLKMILTFQGRPRGGFRVETCLRAVPYSNSIG